MAVLSGIIPVFLLIGLGAWARHLGWAGDAFVRDLNRVIFWFAIPALLVRLIGRAALSSTETGPMITSVVGATVVSALVAWLFTSLRRHPPRQSGVIVQAAIRGNLVYVGFPIIYAAAGTDALALAAVVAAVLIPFQNLLSVLALLRAGDHRGPAIVKAVALNPVVLGVAGGLLWNWIGWTPWTWMDNFLVLLGNIAMPGALLALGAHIDFRSIRSSTEAVAVSTSVKLILAPATGWLLMSLFGIHGEPMLVGVLLLATPTAVASTAIAQEMGGDLDLAGACVVGASLASFPTTILWGLVCG